MRSVGAALGIKLTLPAAPSSAAKTGSGEAAEDNALRVAGVKRVAAGGDDLGGDFGDLDVGNDESSQKKRRK